MTATTTAAIVTGAADRKRGPAAAGPRRGPGPRAHLLSTIFLLIGAVYCLVPVIWVLLASTKPEQDLFTSFGFVPGTALFENLGELFAYRGGAFGWWAMNSAFYSLGGALASTLVSAAAGYAFAMYEFRGKNAIFGTILAGVLVPGIVLAIPQYFLFASVGLTDSRWGILLLVIVSPFGIYLSRVYAEAAISTELLEAARVDGASEFRIFSSIAVPIMVPGMVTVFLLQFIGIWNNFLLPFLMLSSDDKLPVTVGLYTVLNRGSEEGSLWTLTIVGSALSLVVILVIMGVLQRFWKLDLLSGSVKG